jgi:hypothetical protein
MTLFFASCDCAGKYSSAGKHVPGCPMDSSCHFCGQKPFLCRMMGKCGGIAKLSKTFDLREQARKTMKDELTKQLNKIVQRLNLLINLGHVSEAFTKKIDALKAAFSKRQLDPKSLESAEKILLQLQRIYVTQKAASDKKLKEEDDAAQAECDAYDFMPGRAD